MLSREVQLKKLIEAHTRRLHLLEQKVAKLGDSADPSIFLEIEDIKTQIRERRQELAGIETGLDFYGLLWLNFRSKVEKSRPEAKHLFYAIDLLQQLRLPLYRELIIHLAARWDGTGVDRFKAILDEFERHIFSDTDNAQLIKPVRTQCKNTGFRLMDDEFGEGFLDIIEQFSNQIDYNVLLSGICNYCQQEIEIDSQIELSLWALITKYSRIRSIGYFNTGVSYRNQGDDFRAAEYFFDAIKTDHKVARYNPWKHSFLSRSHLKHPKPSESVIIKSFDRLCQRLLSLYPFSEFQEDLLIEIASEPLAQFPRNRAAHDILANVYDQLGRPMDETAEILAVNEEDSDSLWKAAADKLQVSSETAQERFQEVMENLREEIRSTKRKKLSLEERLREEKKKIEAVQVKVRELNHKLSLAYESSEKLAIEETHLENQRRRLEERRDPLERSRYFIKNLLKSLDNLEKSPSLTHQALKTIDEKMTENRRSLPKTGYNKISQQLNRLTMGINDASNNKEAFKEIFKILTQQLDKEEYKLSQIKDELNKTQYELEELRKNTPETIQEKIALQNSSLITLKRQAETTSADIDLESVSLGELSDRLQTTKKEYFIPVQGLEQALEWAVQSFKLKPRDDVKDLIAKIETRLQCVGKELPSG